ncbi:hypothetical protein AND_000148 [Anopheles darlingi]|uniref:Uncharacterized protein n=1 Tax=Anopheles darlingi TaxID=43151 RepID=W5JXA9_ANODA|nr:hypothetical protein AND_000148 [Anopheles darlingi]
MNEIYNVVGICLGIPPEKFTWECYDKSEVSNDRTDPTDRLHPAAVTSKKAIAWVIFLGDNELENEPK